MVVNATFKEPDLQNAKHWSFLAPLLAAAVGIFFDLCCGFLIPSFRARHKDIEHKESSMVEKDCTGDRNAHKESFEDKDVAECPASTSICTKDDAAASDNGQKSVGNLLESTSLQLQGHPSYKGNKSLSEDDSTESARFNSGENAGMLNDAGKRSAVSLAKANSNSNLVFLSGQPQEELQSDARGHGIRELPVSWQTLIPQDEQVWSLAHHPATEGSGLNPWVSHGRQGSP